MEELYKITEEIIALSDKGIEALTRFVKEHGNYIDTSDDSGKTTIYAYIFNEEMEVCEEEQVEGVEVDSDGDLCVRTRRGTYPIDGGFVLVNATVYNLCESLPEYVNN